MFSKQGDASADTVVSMATIDYSLSSINSFKFLNLTTPNRLKPVKKKVLG